MKAEGAREMERPDVLSAVEYAELVETDFQTSRWSRASTDVWLDVLREMPDLKHAVSLNKVLPDEILDILSRDDDSNIRSTVARKRRLPHAVFVRLASDRDESVRMGIACNAKTPTGVLESMRDDPWIEVADRVKERLADK